MTSNMKIALGLAGIAVLAVAGWWSSRRGKSEAPEAAPAKAPDDQDLEYLRGAAHALVWTGFHDRDEIIGILPDVVAVEVDESVLAPIVDAEFALKRAAEKSWPERTDCDRLDEAFDVLNQRGIFARQYQGYTQSDGLADMSEALAEAEAEGGRFTGYCFYTAQDAETAISDSRKLWLAFGTNLEQASEAEQALGAPNNVGAVEAGQLIAATLRELGFDVAWEGTTGSRIEIRGLDWKRRSVPGGESGEKAS